MVYIASAQTIEPRPWTFDRVKQTPLIGSTMQLDLPHLRTRELRPKVNGRGCLLTHPLLMRWHYKELVRYNGVWFIHLYKYELYIQHQGIGAFWGEGCLFTHPLLVRWH